ncbi:CHAP domain-containing protein, partial [Staphylococcus caprae]
MKKIATATIATAGIATFAFASHDAHAAEQNNGGYNPNDPSSYSYSYTIDQEGNYHYTWQGNWSPDRLDNNYNNYGNTNQSYSNAYNQTGGLGSSYSSTSRNVHVTSTSAPSSNGVSLSNASSAGGNLYTSGQCTYYVFDRVGGKIGS